MTIGAHTLKPASGSRTTVKRLGRGAGSGKGTTAARGTKGQRARSGGRSGRARLGFKAALQKVPKLRGFKSFKPTVENVTLTSLNRAFNEGVVVTKPILEKKGLIHSSKSIVKVLATGKLEKKLTLKGCVATTSAAKLIEQAGGKLL